MSRELPALVVSYLKHAMVSIGYLFVDMQDYYGFPYFHPHAAKYVGAVSESGATGLELLPLG